MLTGVEIPAGALPTCHVVDGLHHARLVGVRRFGNAYGPRIGFHFELQTGETVLASAAPSTNPRSRLAELLRGILGREPTEAELADTPETLAGIECKVLTRTETNRNGKTYSSVITVIR